MLLHNFQNPLFTVNGVSSLSITASSTHPQYDYYKTIWTMIDDFVLGEKQVKSKGQLYLPKLPQWDIDEYNYHKELAPFTNFTVRTINALLGAMFMKDPLVKLPESVSYLLTDADGRNNSLLQVVRRVGLEGIKKGRSGLFVDFPNVEAEGDAEVPSLAQTADLKARIIHFDAQSIVDWQEDENGLVMVKLLESHSKRGAKNEVEYYSRERVLNIYDGVYTVSIYEEDTLIEEFRPTDAQGNYMSKIPFFFHGAVNNDATCDNSPVYEIVSKNKTHYQLEAEIMRSIRIIGSPMVAISIGSMSADQFLEVNGLTGGGELQFGVSRGLILGSGGAVSIVQANANDMAQSKADKVLLEATMLGARLVTKNSGRATAEQIRIETSAENSVTQSIAKNLESAIVQAINACQVFMTGNVEDVTFSMNTEFYAQNPDAQILMFAKEMLADASNTFAPSDMFTLLKNSGMIDSNRTIDEVFNEANSYKSVIDENDDENDEQGNIDESNEQDDTLI